MSCCGVGCSKGASSQYQNINAASKARQQAQQNQPETPQASVRAQEVSPAHTREVAEASNGDLSKLLENLYA